MNKELPVKQLRLTQLAALLFSTSLASLGCGGFGSATAELGNVEQQAPNAPEQPLTTPDGTQPVLPEDPSVAVPPEPEGPPPLCEVGRTYDGFGTSVIG